MSTFVKTTTWNMKIHQLILSLLFLAIATSAGAESRPVVFPVVASEVFTTPEEVVLSFLASLTHKDVSSALNCFDFEFAELNHNLSVGLPPDEINRMLAEHPTRIFGKATQQRVSAELQQKVDLVGSAATTIVDQRSSRPLEWIFVVRYELPDGRWERPQIRVAKTRKGWRVINANLPEFKKA